MTAESNRGQLDAYILSAQWDLEGYPNDVLFYHCLSLFLDFSATNSALKYDCCPTLYPFVLYTIRIRRRSLYYVTNIVGNEKHRIPYSAIKRMFICFIVPCFLISCMTILGFLLAPDGGEKLTLRKFEFDEC